MNVLVTGASGFIGRALCARLVAKGHMVSAAVRRAPADFAVAGCRVVGVGDIDGPIDWRAAVTGIDVVVHLAARVHILRESSADALSAFRKVNVEGTVGLARAAAAAGVKRLVFLSSIKVNGESTSYPFTETDAPAPQDAYGVSKLEAERALETVSRELGLQVVTVRPPLVYGPGVKANFLALIKAVAAGWPLPLASIENRRSFVYVGNLVEALIVCMDHPEVANRTWLITDNEDLSTPSLVSRIAAALGVRPRLVPMPVSLLEALGTLIGRRAAVERLTASLQADSSAFRRAAAWSPPFTVGQGIEETVRWFRSLNR